MQQNGSKYFCPQTHPPCWGCGQKVKPFFLKVVSLHITLKGIEHRTPCKQIFCPYTHSRPLGWGQKVNFFPESGNVAYQIKVKEV